MNLKECFAYQKYLAGVLFDAQNYLCNIDVLYDCTAVHHYSREVDGVEDKEEKIEQTTQYDNDKVIRLMSALLDERTKVNLCIKQAKAAMEFDFDGELDTNRMRRTVIDALRKICRTKKSDRVEKGTGYRFNANMEQVAYRYDIEYKMTERFDREQTRKDMKRLRAEADAVSSKLDEVITNTQVDFVPLFNVGDDFCEIMENHTDFFA